MIIICQGSVESDVQQLRKYSRKNLLLEPFIYKIQSSVKVKLKLNKLVMVKSNSRYYILSDV